MYYSLPSATIRVLLGTIDSDGYRHWDKDDIVRSEYSVSVEKWYTQQGYLIADNDLLLGKLSEQKKTLVWLMEDLRRESSASREKYGEFYAEKRINYIGYLKDGRFIAEELKMKTSSSEKIRGFIATHRHMGFQALPTSESVRADSLLAKTITYN